MEELFFQLSAVLGVAMVTTLIVRWLGQPLIVGYLLTGVFLGPTVFGIVTTGDAIDLFGQLGVALLLFMVGLSLRPKAVRDVGAISLMTGIGQIVFTSILGYFIAVGLGYSTVVSVYLAVAFTFSSTIIIVQLLYAKEEHETLYGRIAIGFLLVQDLVAMLLFLFLTSVSPSESVASAASSIVLRLATVVLAVSVLTVWVMPKIEELFARSREALFLFALCVCFLFATGFRQLGFSQELGALLAGIALSTSQNHRDIASRLSPLRDFFLMMFFVVLGTHVSAENIVTDWPMILTFSAFILVGNPLIVMAIMKPLKYTLATSFSAGLTVAQISEFSLILLATGASLGHIPVALIGPATVVGLLTIFVSSYFIMHHQRLFHLLEPALRRVFGRDQICDLPQDAPATDVLLFGCHRLGGGIVDALEHMRARFLVVDHDPEIIRALRAAEVPHVLGAADDLVLLDSLPLASARTVISTVPDASVNEVLVRRVRERNSAAVILCVANHQEQAALLYELGATYVIVPPFLGRRYMVDLLTQYGFDKKRYEEEKRTHLKELIYLKESPLL